MHRLFTFLLFWTFLIIPKTHAVPAYPHPVSIMQPDGTTITVQLHGDEFRKVRSTIDGYVIRKNEKGFYTYAVRDENNQVVPGEKIARDPEKRTADERSYLSRVLKTSEVLTEEVSIKPSKIKQAPELVSSTGFPKTGSPKSLVIMVNFSDVSFVTPNPQDAFYRLLNQENYSDNGGTGSARDYFMAASNGQFSPQFDVVGPYTLPQTMAYYGANDASGNDVKPAYMVVHACSLANNDVDFTQYDADGDGYIDNVFIYYAGYNEAEWGPENSIWPHRWAVYRNYNYSGTPQSIVFDGKTLFDYACTSELKGKTGSNMCGIGTFTHEFGHVIGLPDYYHTEADEKNTLNNWSIMDAGAYLNQGRTPPTYSAYDRFFLGWLTPEELNTPADESLYPLSQSRIPVASTDKQAYLLSATAHNLNGGNPSPKEFYVMEYRKKTGWDTYLPAEGLLFWHIDYDQTAWDNNTPNNYTGTSQTASSHMRVYLQPLSGYTTTPGTAFTSGSFDPLTWSGVNINREITNITKTSDSISFKIMGGTPVNPNLPKIMAGKINELLQFSTTKPNTENIKYLNINTTDLSGDLTINISGTNADLFTSSAQTIYSIVANSEAGVNIDITYKPLNTGNHTAIMTISGGGLNPEKVIQLNGISAE